MDKLDLFNIALDGYSALLCAMMGVHALMAARGRRDEVSRCFAGICLANAVMALGDITSWAPAPPLDRGQYALVMAGSFAYYVAVMPIYLFFTGYIVSYLERRTQLAPAVRRVAPPLLGALFVAYSICCVASLWNGMLFVVTPEAGYERGDLFWISQASVIALHLFNAAIILRHFGCLTAAERLGFVSYLLLPMAANAVQVALFGVALLNAAITLALLIIFISIQSERKALLARREQELAEARADIMLSQIQPHFLYNTLTAIREMCLSDPTEAARMVTDFSAYLRENMASLTSRAPIPFERELRHARTYLALEQKRFGNRLRVEFDVRATAFSLPPLSLQALAENAVRHGVTKREEGGRVRVASAEEPDAFVVTVADDGVGFEPDAARLDGRLHVGIANVSARVEGAVRRHAGGGQHAGRGHARDAAHPEGGGRGRRCGWERGRRGGGRGAPGERALDGGMAGGRLGRCGDGRRPDGAVWKWRSARECGGRCAGVAAGDAAGSGGLNLAVRPGTPRGRSARSATRRLGWRSAEAHPTGARSPIAEGMANEHHRGGRRAAGVARYRAPCPGGRRGGRGAGVLAAAHGARLCARASRGRGVSGHRDARYERP